jgi:hypothetical protein
MDAKQGSLQGLPFGVKLLLALRRDQYMGCRYVVVSSIDPSTKVIGRAHRHFIALYDLRKLTIGDDFSSLGARHHKPMHRALDMSH